MKLSFDDCIFDPDTREVLRSGRVVQVSPKAFTLLNFLIQCRPKAVSKTDIHAQLWPETFVSEANLANLVVELRGALGDSARKPRIIRTLARYGYAFCAEATSAPEREAAPAADGSPLYRLIWGRREIALDPGANLLGRERDAVVWIDDESVSRRHAHIVIRNEGAAIEDLGSKNGTYVRGRKIRQATELADGDTVKIGPASMVLRVLQRTGSTRSAMKQRTHR